MVDNGLSSICLSKLPVPRTAISPKKAFRIPIARFGPTADKTCCIKSNSISFNSFCSFIVSFNNSSLWATLFFSDFTSIFVFVSSTFVLSSPSSFCFSSLPSILEDSSISASITFKSSSFICSALSPNFARLSSIAIDANVVSSFCNSVTLSMPDFKNFFSARINFALTRGGRNSATVAPSTAGSAFIAKPSARSNDLERKSAAAFALESVTFVMEKSYASYFSLRLVTRKNSRLGTPKFFGNAERPPRDGSKNGFIGDSFIIPEPFVFEYRSLYSSLIAVALSSASSFFSALPRASLN
mmetsp:Transcript_27428/g.30763  ORF Transcript_27428/g.30763 Transcript_27428/m.30763 type:complete len:299 (-) Transcript_27428:408-1304(-)